MRAYREARRHMERALELWDHVPSPEEVWAVIGSICS